MISNKNIRAINKHIRHMESMDNAIKFEKISLKRSNTQEGKKNASKWKKLFQKWKQFSKSKISKIHLTQKCNSKDLYLNYDQS